MASDLRSPTLRGECFVRSDETLSNGPLMRHSLQFLEIHAEDTFDRNFFVEELAPRYGRLVRAFQCTYAAPGGRVSALRTATQKIIVRDAWRELSGVAHHLGALRTLFTEVGKGITAPGPPGADFITALASAGALTNISTLDLRVVPAHGLLADPQYLATLLTSFPTLQDLFITFCAYSIVEFTDLETLPPPLVLINGLGRLAHLRRLSVQGLLIRSDHAFEPWIAPLEHLDLLSSYVDHDSAVALTSTMRDSLKSLRIAHYALRPASTPLDAPFDLPHLTRLTLRYSGWQRFLPTFLSSPVRNLIIEPKGGMPEEGLRVGYEEGTIDSLEPFRATLREYQTCFIGSPDASRAVREWCAANGIVRKIV